MTTNPSGLPGIARSGSPGSYTYGALGNAGERPVNYVSFYDALRFANWMNNGQGSGDTETGAYTLLGGTSTPSNGTTVTRNAAATIFLPSANEWYKAACYDEWNETRFSDGAGSSRRGVHGGSFADSAYALAARPYFGGGDYATAEYGLLGFRLATTPEPGTAALLSLGLTLLARQRRRAA